MRRSWIAMMLVLISVGLLPNLGFQDPHQQSHRFANLGSSTAVYPNRRAMEEIAADVLTKSGLTAHLSATGGQGLEATLTEPSMNDPALVNFIKVELDHIARVGPLIQDQNLTGFLISFETKRHLLGTDAIGRDRLARLVHGFRGTLVFATMVVAMTLTAGILLGALSGLLDGRIDGAITRFSEAIYAFPALFIVVLGSIYLGVSPLALALMISVIELPEAIRYMRGIAASTSNEPFISASRALGGSTPHILWHHLLPNALPLVVPFAAIAFVRAVTLESTASFLGIGLQEPHISLGVFISVATDTMVSDPMPLALAVTLLSTTLIALMLVAQRHQSARFRRHRVL